MKLSKLTILCVILLAGVVLAEEVRVTGQIDWSTRAGVAVENVSSEFTTSSGITIPPAEKLSPSLTGAGHAACRMRDGRIFVTFHAEGRWFGAVTSLFYLEKGEEPLYRIQLGTAPEGNPPTGVKVGEDGQILAWNGSSAQAECRCVRIKLAELDALNWWNVEHQPRRIPPESVGQKCQTTPPPAGAIVLFDGSDLDAWENGANWLVKDGYAEIVPGKGSITTRQAFGDCQLHLEFATPELTASSPQMRGNSGVYLQSRYEVQILDSYRNLTYALGLCGALYTQNPPRENACLPPGQWQSYDITYTAPRFDDAKNLLTPARITVYQNGVLIQDDFQITGRNMFTCGYIPHNLREPLLLQEHGCPVRFRNIWILEK